MESKNFRYKHNGTALCICTECYEKHKLRCTEGANTEYPECDDCSNRYNPIVGGYDDYFCDLHKPPPTPPTLKAPARRPNQAEADTAYAFTLTSPPGYKHTKTIEEVAELICTKGLTNKPYEKPTQWAFVLEHTEAGTPHIHAMYKTPSGRRIADKYFQRYWPLWDVKVKLGSGHKGGYHQKARHNESYEAYMQKEGCVHSSELNSPV
jgi:hypothetical protein